MSAPVFHIVVGRVTCPDAADLYSRVLGRPVCLGDPEYRVMEDIDKPGYSADFPTREMAIMFAYEERRLRNG